MKKILFFFRSSNRFVKFVKKHQIIKEIMHFLSIVLHNFAIITRKLIKQSMQKILERGIKYLTKDAKFNRLSRKRLIH
jgi:hypothetical protein